MSENNKSKDTAKTNGAGRGPGGPGGGPGGAERHGYVKPQNTMQTLLRMIRYMGPRKWQLLLVLVLMLINSGTYLAATYMLRPLLNDYIIPGDVPGLVGGIGIKLLLHIVSVACSYGYTRLMLYIGQKTTNLMRKELFDKLQTLPLRYFDASSHGELMSRFTNDVETISQMLEQSMVQVISGVVSFIGTAGMMIALNAPLFLVSVVMMGIMLLVSGRIGKQSRGNFQAQQATLGEMNGYVEELIEGQRVVKVFNREEIAKEEFEQLNEKYRVAATNANFFAGIIMPIMNNLNNISYALTAAVGGIMAVGGVFDIGGLAAFLQYSRQFSQPINQITNQMNIVFAALAGAERVFDVMDQVPEVDDGDITLVHAFVNADGSIEQMQERTGTWAWKIPQEDGSFAYVELKGDVRLNDVTFAYDDEHVVLHDVSLFAKPGQKIAFVGSTGAGKTTITNLINRFYDVQEGSITYDGIDVKRIKKDSLRTSMAMVLQDTHLFSGTVMENIRYGRLDATDAEVEQAAKMANADSFIRRLPEGYHTMLVADGSNLSQGQRQLVSIARAAVADAPVLVLDEATSSIDTRTEKLIERGMDRLMENRTVFVIAHRLSTVRNSKAIIVLEHGEIVERGDHETLLEKKGRYYQLYTGQSELE